MEPALKQRLIGAAVLVALAVIFLPMLIKGPAPESGVSDIPLDLPTPPGGEFETRELPLVTPAGSSSGSVTGMGSAPLEDGALPTVEAGATPDGMMPATTAGGGYAVSFGSYASADDAKRVVAALRQSQLAGYQETAVSNGRTLYRVRIGPFDSRATAEAARLRAAHVRDDVGSQVVVLDAAVADEDVASTPASVPTAAPDAPVSKPDPLPDDTAAAKPATTRPAEKPVEKPTRTAAADTPVASTPRPAASGVGFAVQLGAFSSAADANALRDRARAAGLGAFVEQVNTDKGELSRVQVGPVADRAAAERLKAQVAAKLGIEGFVHAHP